MANEPNFDWAQAASLLGDNPNQVSEDMLALVLELVQSGDERLEELKAKNPSAGGKEIPALAHQLRGSLLNFGFVGVGMILLQVEKGEYSSPEQYLNLINQAQTAFEASKKMLTTRYPAIRIP